MNHLPATNPSVQLSGGYLLRPIEKKDNLPVAQLIRTVMTEFECVGEGYSIEDREVDQMFDTYHHKRAAFYVIENKKGQISGCGGIGPLEGGAIDICELKKMYFYSELRGKGFGKLLVDHCLDAARKIGYQNCYLETVERMEAANRLYQKMGFTRSNIPLGNTGHSKCEAYYFKEL